MSFTINKLASIGLAALLLGAAPAAHATSSMTTLGVGLGPDTCPSNGLGPPTCGPAGPPPPTTCTQATTYLARATGETTHAADLKTLICGLVTDGVITGDMSTTGCGTTLDALWLLAQQSQADALLNLCGTNFTGTINGSLTFTALTGFSGFNVGSLNFINTHFNSTTATSPNYTQNSASLGVWSVATVVETASQMGTTNVTGTGDSSIIDSFTGNEFFAWVNSAAAPAFVANPGTKGLYVAERPNATTIIPFWDGSSQGTQSSTSGAPDNLTFVIGAANAATTGTAQTLSEAHIGAALGPALNLALFTRLRAYMTAVGVP